MLLATTKNDEDVVDDSEKIPKLTSSGFRVERPEEPAAISAISDAKMKAKQSLKKRSKKTITTGSTMTTTDRKVFPRVIHRNGRDKIRYFTDNGREIKAAQSRKILDGVRQGCITVKAANTQLNDTTKVPVLNKKRTPLKLIQGQGNLLGTVQKYDPIGEVTRAASPSGLVRRNKNAAGSIVCR